MRRKADRARIAVEVVEPQRLPLDQDDLEQPVANGGIGPIRSRSSAIPEVRNASMPPPSRRRESAP